MNFYCEISRVGGPIFLKCAQIKFFMLAWLTVGLVCRQLMAQDINHFT